MVPQIRRLAGAVLGAVALAAIGCTAAPAMARDQAFFDSIVGTWKGPGRVVAGKYKGTRFVCDLTGDPLKPGRTGIAMGGHCRVGVFSQDMSAVITRAGTGYEGRFQDGAEGKGLDVISGEVGSHKAVVGINRKQLFGAMVANLLSPDTMNVTISVKVQDHYVPVIGMTLTRSKDERTVGSVE